MSLRSQLRPLAVHYRQFRHRLKLKYLHATQRQTPRLRIFVLAEPRTGSNLLVDYLNTIDGVSAQEEILNHRDRIGLRRSWITRGASLRHIDYSMNIAADVVVAKLMLHHLRWRRLTVDDLIDRYENARFIVLYRQDLVRQFVSACILMQTHADRLRSDGRFDGKITIDRTRLESFCESQKRDFANVLASDRLGRLAALLSYEELAASPQEIFNERICPLIGITPAFVKTTMRKQNIRPLEDIVENYSDIRDLIQSDLASHAYDLDASAWHKTSQAS